MDFFNQFVDSYIALTIKIALDNYFIREKHTSTRKINTWCVAKNGFVLTVTINDPSDFLITNKREKPELYKNLQINDLRQVGGFLRGNPDASTNKTNRYDITEIVLKAALSTTRYLSVTGDRSGVLSG
jgi:hypothetical protein